MAIRLCVWFWRHHLISDDAAFKKAVGQAVEQAHAGNLVVFGIRPTAPETGYGYLEVAAPGDAPQSLKSFVEKPDRVPLSDILLKAAITGTRGMFCFTTEHISEKLAHASDVWVASEVAFAQAHESNGITRFEEASFIAQPDISIDYAVMEKAEKIALSLPVLVGRMSALGTL